MNNNINPCIWCDGNAKEASEFYTSVFDNSAILSENKMVVIFEVEGKKFMALNGGPMFKTNPSISIFVMCETEQEIEKKWKMLSDGGLVMMGLNKYPWSDKYGWCQDKFGISWQLMMGKITTDKIIPSLMFTQKNSGRAEEAINFYTQVFENSSTIIIDKYVKGEPDVEGYVKHGRFILNGQTFSCMDSSGPHNFTFNEGFSFVIDCDNQKEIDYYWEKLTTGGQESQCGWLKDKFGISWQVVPTILGKLMSDPEKAPRVVQAFMKMKKFNIAELENA